jgi:hypothetical protein
MQVRGLQGASRSDETGLVKPTLIRASGEGENMRKSIKDDEIYVPIRAEICDAYIVAGKPKPERNWLYCRLVKVTLENQELEMLFDLQH